TQPCANMIVKKGIKKVVIGLKDPNPLVAGKGIKVLQDAGIEVVTGILGEEGKKLNEIFLKYITAKVPFVIMKTAMTLDGKIATHTNESKWRSEERRVGKRVDLGGRRIMRKKKEKEIGTTHNMKKKAAQKKE